LFTSILAATDGSARAERAVHEAIDLAKSQGARLLLVTAFPSSRQYWEQIQSSARVATGHLESVAEQVLMRAARPAEEQGLEVEYEAREGDPADVILDVAAEHDVDAIVLGNKGLSGARRYLLGSVPSKVAHHATCAVIIIPTGD
jgi:nucleotide-binding universal stress UspA family protein